MMSGSAPLRGFSEYRTSAVVLIAANALPLFGVLFLGWDTFSIIALYWVENVIVGTINVLKMITSNPDASLLVLGDADPHDKLNSERMRRSRGGSVVSLRIAYHASKLFFIPFFIFHYGMFCLVHGVLVFALFGHESRNGFGLFGPLASIGEVFSEHRMWLCVLSLAASHLWSFSVNYLGRGEYRRSNLMILMGQPYGRVVVLHLAILFGGFVTMALGSNILVLLILIAGKTMIDLALHLRERDKNALSQPQTRSTLPAAPQSPSSTMQDVLPCEAGQSPAMPTISER
jgi:hypothetical protein